MECEDALSPQPFPQVPSVGAAVESQFCPQLSSSLRGACPISYPCTGTSAGCESLAGLFPRSLPPRQADAEAPDGDAASKKVLLQVSCRRAMTP